MKRLATFILLITLFAETSCDDKKEDPAIAAASITAISDASEISTNEAMIMGTVTDKALTTAEYGFVFSTTDNPTVENATVAIAGTSIATSPFNFKLKLTGLIENTTYYVRTYAKNSGVVSYSNSATFKTATYTVSSHLSSASNTSGHISTIIHDALNSNPNAIVILTANWQGGSVYNKSAIGIYYEGERWRIFNQDFVSMPLGVKYNLLITNPGDRAFKHVSAPSNMAGNTTAMDHPLLNNNPNAKILVTQRWNGTYNNSPIGVYFSGGKWRIFNQNMSALKAGCEFNVLISDDIVMTEAKAGKITGNNFLIDPAITTSTKAVFVTQYWTAVYNNQEVGVWSPSTWSIYNQNPSINMPVGAKFFVLGR